MKILLYSGGLCLSLPFVLMLLEYLWAFLHGASGERLAASGFWGVLLGYYSIPVGVVLLGLVFMFWLLRR